MPTERVYLLADMHLKPSDAPAARARELAAAENERLAAFLAHIMNPATAGADAESRPPMLILLGDAFNFWLERKSRVIGDYSIPLNLFKRASDKGLVIHHISGNRDFIVGEGLGFDPVTRYPGFIKYGGGFTVSRLVDFGIEVHGPRFRFHQAGKTFGCLHGDSLCTGDWEFMLLRWLLQGFMGRTFFKYAPWPILKRLISRQQARTEQRAAAKNHVAKFNESAIRREIAMSGADILVCGHIHRPHGESVTIAGRECKLLVLPAWLDGGYAVAENGELTVKEFRTPPPPAT